ncbi:ORF3b [Bat SARS coronavirus HKU3]|uniref:ORF3b n=1 Tax=Bat coronavirus HKU3 TaxID=442736 RepID=A0A7G6UAK1_BCHK3|nr:ORF3b [Bat SARS coronavirus HKU3]QND76036.1 ORF3b [Bat SARS coronavirus HKU3]
MMLTILYVGILITMTTVYHTTVSQIQLSSPQVMEQISQN